MFCWPSRSRSAKAKLKIKNLGNPAKKSHLHHGTFKCDLSEALLATEDKCSHNSNTSGGDILLLYNDQNEDFNFKSLWGKDISEWNVCQQKNNANQIQQQIIDDQNHDHDPVESTNVLNPRLQIPNNNNNHGEEHDDYIVTGTQGKNGRANRPKYSLQCILQFFHST